MNASDLTVELLDDLYERREELENERDAYDRGTGWSGAWEQENWSARSELISLIERISTAEDDLEAEGDLEVAEEARIEAAGTYSYRAVDAGGNVIERQGLTYEEWEAHNGNLLVAGYRVEDLTEPKKDLS